jgi:hypothetical protein
MSHIGGNTVTEWLECMCVYTVGMHVCVYIHVCVCVWRGAADRRRELAQPAELYINL